MSRMWMFFLAGSPILAGIALFITVLAAPGLFSEYNWALITTSTLTLLAGVSQVSGVTLRELFSKPAEHPVLQVSVNEGSPGFLGASRLWAEVRNVGAADAKSIAVEASLSDGAPFQLDSPSKKAPALPVGEKFEFDLVNSLPGGQHGDAVVTIRVRYTDYHGRQYNEESKHPLKDVSDEHMRQMLRRPRGSSGR